MNINIVRQHLSWFRFLPADIMFLSARNKDVIEADLARNLDEIPYEHVGLGALNYSLMFIKPFRNVFYFRNESRHVLRYLSKILLKPLDTIEIFGEYEAGLRIYHNYCLIGAHHVGRNFTVRQGATIGKGRADEPYSATNNPTLGDNVVLMTNAIVFGGIHIGDNVIISAGAVVTKDVPDNCVVAGNPARIIMRDGVRV